MEASNSKKLRLGIAGIMVAAVLPFSFYIVAKVLKKDQIAMPRYFIADGLRGKDTLYHKVGELEGINQFGDKVALNKDLKDRMLIVDFFFSDGRDSAGRLTHHMRKLSDAFKRTPMARNDTLVQFISITLDPARDSFRVLRAYADRFGADGNRWWFITGDRQSLYEWARNELRLALPAGNNDSGFMHTSQITLIDAQRNIRGYYNGLDSLDAGKCAQDIGLLAMEKNHK